MTTAAVLQTHGEGLRCPVHAKLKLLVEWSPASQEPNMLSANPRVACGRALRGRLRYCRSLQHREESSRALAALVSDSAVAQSGLSDDAARGRRSRPAEPDRMRGLGLAQSTTPPTIVAENHDNEDGDPCAIFVNAEPGLRSQPYSDCGYVTLALGIGATRPSSAGSRPALGASPSRPDRVASFGQGAQLRQTWVRRKS